MEPAGAEATAQAAGHLVCWAGSHRPTQWGLAEGRRREVPSFKRGKFLALIRVPRSIGIVGALEIYTLGGGVEKPHKTCFPTRWSLDSERLEVVSARRTSRTKKRLAPLTRTYNRLVNTYGIRVSIERY
jgi:hypothetical protein